VVGAAQEILLAGKAPTLQNQKQTTGEARLNAHQSFPYVERIQELCANAVPVLPAERMQKIC
jgi:hypothetical protein